MNFEKSPFENQEVDQFESQFSSPETIKVLDGEVEVVDIIPEKLEKEIPLLFASGWSCTPDTYKDTIKIMSQRGRRTLGVKHARRGISGESIKRGLNNESKEHSIDELRKTISILAILKEKNIDKVDAIAHSEGAINVAIAASIEPTKFNTIVFLNPAGLIGKDNIFSLTRRFFAHNIREATANLFSKNSSVAENDRFKQFAHEQTSYIASNIYRALKESQAISQSDITDLLKTLKEAGIKVIVMAGADDPLFPMDKIQKNAKADQVDGFISAEGGHAEIVMHPERFVPAIDSMLSQDENENQ